jgi:hypothetical protein
MNNYVEEIKKGNTVCYNPVYDQQLCVGDYVTWVTPRRGLGTGLFLGKRGNRLCIVSGDEHIRTLAMKSVSQCGEAFVTSHQYGNFLVSLRKRVLSDMIQAVSTSRTSSLVRRN